MVGTNRKGVIMYKNTDVGKPYLITSLPAFDVFYPTKLELQHGWNHNPDSIKWSLTQNPGNLRISTAKIKTNLRDARYTLTQIIFAYSSKTFLTTAIIKINKESMKDGNAAGLAVFRDPYAFIDIKKISREKYIAMINNAISVDSVAMIDTTVYLQATDYYGTSREYFYFCFDN